MSSPLWILYESSIQRKDFATKQVYCFTFVCKAALETTNAPNWNTGLDVWRFSNGIQSFFIQKKTFNCDNKCSLWYFGLSTKVFAKIFFKYISSFTKFLVTNRIDRLSRNKRESKIVCMQKQWNVCNCWYSNIEHCFK